MKLIFKKVALAVALSSCAMAWASDGTVTVTGSVSSTTCTVVGNGSSASGSFTVALPAVAKTALSSIGATAGATAFTIGVSGCSGSSTTMTPYFEAGPTINAGGRLINGGTAGNVDVQIKTGSSVVNMGAASGSQGVTASTLVGNAATSNFTAQYYATGTVTAGTFSSSFTYSIVYN